MCLVAAVPKWYVRYLWESSRLRLRSLVEWVGGFRAHKQPKGVVVYRQVFLSRAGESEQLAVVTPFWMWNSNEACAARSQECWNYTVAGALAQARAEVEASLELAIPWSAELSRWNMFREALPDMLNERDFRKALHDLIDERDPTRAAADTARTGQRTRDRTGGDAEGPR